jgi:ADP-ribose pyrophosphatase YjhB (NUDIX family)
VSVSLIEMDLTEDKTGKDHAGSAALDWVKRLQAIAPTGLTYAKDPYDMERYRSVRQIAAEILAAGSSGVLPNQIVDLFARDVGYATPKVDVRAAVFSDKGLLLVRERSDGAWTLPGGWADVGDTPALATVREVKEESGYDVVATKLAAVYDRDHERHGHPPFRIMSINFSSFAKSLGEPPRQVSKRTPFLFFRRTVYRLSLENA